MTLVLVRYQLMLEEQDTNDRVLKEIKYDKDWESRNKDNTTND